MAESLITDAVVLRRVAFGEADVIVTLMTRDAGKLSALARGARRSRRRFGAALELGAISSAELAGRRGGELWTLQAATTRRRFAIGELAALTHASYGAELVRELTAAEQPEPAIFDLLCELWATIGEHGARPIVLRRFELALLAALGLSPALDVCAACGTDALERAVIDPARGALCAACAAFARGLGVRPLSAAGRAALSAAAAAPALAAEPIVGPAGGADGDAEGDGAALEARSACAAIIAHHVGKPLRSLEFMAKVSAGPRPV